MYKIKDYSYKKAREEPFGIEGTFEEDDVVDV